MPPILFFYPEVVCPTLSEKVGRAGKGVSNAASPIP